MPYLNDLINKKNIPGLQSPVGIFPSIQNQLNPLMPQKPVLSTSASFNMGTSPFINQGFALQTSGGRGTSGGNTGGNSMGRNNPLPTYNTDRRGGTMERWPLVPPPPSNPSVGGISSGQSFQPMSNFWDMYQRNGLSGFDYIGADGQTHHFTGYSMPDYQTMMALSPDQRAQLVNNIRQAGMQNITDNLRQIGQQPQNQNTQPVIDQNQIQQMIQQAIQDSMNNFLTQLSNSVFITGNNPSAGGNWETYNPQAGFDYNNNVNNFLSWLAQFSGGV